MKVIVKSGEAKLPLIIWIPSAFAFNSVIAAIGSKYSDLSYKQLNALMKACRKSKKALKGKPLVKADEAGGNRVTVYL